MSIEIIINADMQDKIRYLHDRFSTEWSGPAWYKILEEDKMGFPKKIELVYFRPVDLGTHGSTEFEGEHTGKTIYEIVQNHPEVKECIKGLIHTHHSMSPSPSTTDDTTAKEHAPTEGFFISTVVSNRKGLSGDGLLSYVDQYGFIHLYEEVDVTADIEIPADDAWIQEANEIEEAKADRIQKEKAAKSKAGKGHGSQVNTGGSLTPTTGEKGGTKQGKATIVSHESYDTLDALLDGLAAGTGNTRRTELLYALVNQYQQGFIDTPVIWSTMRANGYQLNEQEFWLAVADWQQEHYKLQNKGEVKDDE